MIMVGTAEPQGAFLVAGSDIPAGYVFIQVICQLLRDLRKQCSETISVCHFPALSVPALRTVQRLINVSGRNGLRKGIAALLAAEEKFLMGIGLLILQYLYRLAVPFLVPELPDPGAFCQQGIVRRYSCPSTVRAIGFLRALFDDIVVTQKPPVHLVGAGCPGHSAYRAVPFPHGR